MTLVGGGSAGLLRGGGQAQAATQPAGPGPRRGGTLTVARAGDFTTFDPLQASMNNRPNQGQVHNRLVYVDLDLKPQPELAESWQVSSDFKKVTLKLRQGVKLHNGREFTAEDVVFNVSHLRDKDAGHQLYAASVNVGEAKAVDKYTAEINLLKPIPHIYFLLTWWFQIGKEVKPSIKTRSLGTGPFKFAEWVPGDYAKFVRNDSYWEAGKPYIDTIIVRSFATPEAMIPHLEAGTIDWIQDVPLSEYKRLSETKGIKVASDDQYLLVHLNLNVRRKPFDNKKVRQAVSYAMNRQEVVNKINFGLGQAITAPIWTKRSPAYDPDLATKAYPFDLKKAKELLTEAGYPNGFSATVLCNAAFAYWKDIMQLFQQDMATIGIKITIEELPGAQAMPRHFAGDFDMAMWMSGPSNMDPALFFNGFPPSFYTKDSPHGFTSDEYVRLVDAGAVETDPEKRKEIYRKVNRLVVDECFAIPIISRPFTFAYRDRLQGWDWDLNLSPRFGSAWLSS